jgi:hypothetical protein
VLPPALLPIAALPALSPSVAALFDCGTTSMAATVAFGVVLAAPAPVAALWPCVMLDPDDPELPELPDDPELS